MDPDDLKVPTDRLRRSTDPEALGFGTTDDLQDMDEIIAQDRAIEAVQFGVGMRAPGYNIFVLGPTGHGRRRIVSRMLAEAAGKRPPPPDWCYVHNFDDPHRPKALKLPPGRGARLKADMDTAIEELKAAIPGAFESDDYGARRRAIDEELQQAQQALFQQIGQEAEAKGIALVRTPMGFAFAPAKDGEVMTPEAFRQLPEDEQKRIQAEIQHMQGRMQEVMARAPALEKEHRAKVRELDREVTRFAVGHLIDELQKGYEDLPEVHAHLEAVEADIVENASQFLPQQNPMMPQMGADGGFDGGERAVHRRYKANLVVDNSQSAGAPVVAEDHPTHPNLFGRIEHIAQFGALATDFNLIVGGALHRANGGFLVLDVRHVLTQPMAWEELKRTLRARELRVESLYQALGMISTVTLEPAPIPLDVKIVLVGDRMLYYMLSAYDPEFGELFKIAADIEDEAKRDARSAVDFARVLATAARADGLRPFGADAVGRILDHAVRRAGDAERLSTQMGDLVDLAREADRFAEEAGAAAVAAGHVKAAEEARIRRVGRVRDRLYERIAQEVVLIDVEGSAVGQMNGLSVLQIGELSFGQPSRITARVRMGRGGVLDVEREAKLGGPLHTKGMMILQGFLAQNYLPDRPLTLSASLVFEQSYGGVDGDSASMAELCALLSAIAGLPLRQDLAMTGSVNQHGASQAIGGVNEKIEGFFDVCRTSGLTGSQGVVIPHANVRHLMLRDDAMETAAAGRFHVYAVRTVEDALALLTGTEPGVRGPDGAFPEGSVHRMVEDRLAAYAETARKFGAGPEKDMSAKETQS